MFRDNFVALFFFFFFCVRAEASPARETHSSAELTNEDEVEDEMYSSLVGPEERSIWGRQVFFHISRAFKLVLNSCHLSRSRYLVVRRLLARFKVALKSLVVITFQLLSHLWCWARMKCERGST